MSQERATVDEYNDLLAEYNDLLAEVERLRGEAERERAAAVVAWLRAQSQLTLYEATPDDVADAIERGEHRAEVTE